MRAIVIATLCGPTLAFAAPVAPIALSVDATEAPRHILHVRETIPAAGPLTLLYPKWIPGEHGPNGPIADLAGIRIVSGGKPIAWRRDPVDMYAIHVDVPQGTSAIDVAFDYLGPPEAEAGEFSSAASMTSKLMVLEWNLVVLYPQGTPARDLPYAPILKLPAGWKWGSALDAARESGPTVEFRPTSLEALVDSPVIAGAYFRAVPVGKDRIPHEVDIAADSPEALDFKSDVVAGWSRLVAETGALFGARHYTRYHFLLGLSDHVAHFGLEHHQSSDNRVHERSLVDEDLTKLSSLLLPHEFTHSWNGKYRRPAGLATPDYQEPMKGDLLWVYEGLTQYYGTVLAGRSAAATPEWVREVLAWNAADMDNTAGRSWRPLADTAVAAQVLYAAREDWASWRRSVDFYPEGTLIWLEADTLIRAKTRDARSLDDFCRRFHGGTSGPPQVVTYRFDDVVNTLNEVAPNDWKGFFESRIEAVEPRAPLGGIDASGWRLVYNDKPNLRIQAHEKAEKTIDLTYSIGLSMKEDGTVVDVAPGLAAAQAGVAPGMKLLGVNGRRWSSTVLHDAVRVTRTTRMELLLENGEYYRTFRLDYAGGERYPHLERVASKPDLLGEILKPKARR